MNEDNKCTRTEKRRGTDFLELKTPCKVSQTDVYLYLFALHYMNCGVALVSWQEMPMGCEYRRTSKPLCKWFSPSSLNELLFFFVIVAFYMFFVTKFRPEMYAMLESDRGFILKEYPTKKDSARFYCHTFGNLY